VTSVALEAARDVTLDTAKQAVVQEFQEVFDISLIEEIEQMPLPKAVSQGYL
jgi:hypothetical protein